MIVDERDIERIKKFVLDEPTEDELDMCDKCGFNEYIESCINRDICLRYTPLEIGDESMKLVRDLFDTIDYLMEVNSRK